MPKYYEYKIAGYYLYFTSYCVIECMHVHASDRKLTEAGSAKFFVKDNGDTVLQNRGILNDREIRKIQEFIKQNYQEMYLKWSEYSHEGYYGKKQLSIATLGSFISPFLIILILQYVFIRMSIASYVFRIVYCGLMGRQYVECFVYDGLSDTDRKEKPVCQEKDSINPAGFKLTGYFFVHFQNKNLEKEQKIC